MEGVVARLIVAGTRARLGGRRAQVPSRDGVGWGGMGCYGGAKGRDGFVDSVGVPAVIFDAVVTRRMVLHRGYAACGIRIL